MASKSVSKETQHQLDLKIKITSAKSQAIRQLSIELHRHLELIYGKGMIEDFEKENNQMIVFYIACNLSGVAVGCGALKHFNETTAEIKRMYVKEEFRGQGISKKILIALEEHAKRLDYKRLILETGLKQPVAISLYKKFNYKFTECYGRYLYDPESRCFEKEIH